MDSLRRLAAELAVPERTLRRAASEGLVHGVRISPRRFRTTLREEMYLRNHWTLLRDLRSALRTEPNVRLAVLFGSTSTGAEHTGSDIDVLVALDDSSASRIAELAGRLSRGLGRETQLVRLHEAESSPVLMADVLKHGRVLVDRDRRWPSLLASATRWQRMARLDQRSIADSMESLDDLRDPAT